MCHWVVAEASYSEFSHHLLVWWLLLLFCVFGYHENLNHSVFGNLKKKAEFDYSYNQIVVKIQEFYDLVQVFNF